MKGPVRKKPCARPTSTPRVSGETPVRYAGRLERKLATTGADVTGVSSMPMNGSPLMGLITCAFSAAARTTVEALVAL